MVYFAFAVTVLIGFWLRNKNSVRLIATGVLVSSLSFFVITNFGVWAFGVLYLCHAMHVHSCGYQARNRGLESSALYVYLYERVCLFCIAHCVSGGAVTWILTKPTILPSFLLVAKVKNAGMKNFSHCFERFQKPGTGPIKKLIPIH